jgi:hypothetical protein
MFAGAQEAPGDPHARRRDLPPGHPPAALFRNRLPSDSARAGASSSSSYATEGITDETLWTDPDDPTLIPYRRAKTVGEKTAWDFMAHYAGPMTLTTILPGAVFGLEMVGHHEGRRGTGCGRMWLVFVGCLWGIRTEIVRWTGISAGHSLVAQGL